MFHVITRSRFDPPELAVPPLLPLLLVPPVESEGCGRPPA
jgi:hypothetical protein